MGLRGGASDHCALLAQEDLKITHHADDTLISFCKWQKNINTKGDDHPLHHDTAILLTRCRLGGARGPRWWEAGDGIPSALGDIFLS